MANSLEGRSPFLCKSFLEYVPTLKDEFKIKGASTKHLLRTLAKRYLPEELIRQPKRGFEVPLKNWVNAELKEPINDYLLASTAFYPQIIKKDFVHGLINNTIVIPSEKRAKILWTLFSLEVWYKKNYLVQAI
jgi:asparagine synthase (glutamine-hydrolysing)